ncbi:ATP-binding protein [Streptomyces kebangsaanensis]|uniref:hypothetical protein n=1 Tax=Streptomyces kebangsaanensis TaxID=864058 RepID=UPI0009A12F54|nr:hypothetical protein [Streptomyces kebangsaanensis]
MKPPTERTALPSLKTEAPPAAEKHPVSATVILLPLQPEEEPRWAWKTKLRADAGAGPNARLRLRPRLTMAVWAGNIDIAARIADKLVDNAARHGKPFGDGCVGLGLTLFPGTDELLIEVDDAAPEFPDFETVACGAPAGRGLWWVEHYRARLSWDVKKDKDGQVVGKTVQALVPVSWRELA